MFSRSRHLLKAAKWISSRNLSTLRNVKFYIMDFSPHTINAPFRRFCTPTKIPIVYYDEIKDLPNHPQKLLIDVRDPNEVKFGKIPLSINIPLCELRTELSMNNCDSDQFRKKYGREKPIADTYIIMHCRTGQRASVAAEIATILGYKNVHNYYGSWLDYIRNETSN